MKHVYCAECGTKLEVTRKALPKYSTIIDIVPWHQCLDTPIEFDLSVNPIPIEPKMPDGKFVRNLNKLEPSIPRVMAEGEVIGDRRPSDQVKQTSIAPKNLLDQMKSITHTELVGELSDPEE